MAKSKYESHVAPFLDKITLWAEKGASQAEIAGKLNLAVSTFKLYLSKGEKGEKPYTDLSDCFRTACEVPDDNVETALYKSAIGYNAKVAKTFKVKEVIYDETTGKKLRETEKLVSAFDEVHVPANVTAQMFWLANRKPDRWRYKPEPVNDDEDGGTGVVELPPVMDAPAPPEVSGDG
jgi:hypothetical protein